SAGEVDEAAIAAAIAGQQSSLTARLRGPELARLAGRMARAGAGAGLTGMGAAAPRVVAGLRRPHHPLWLDDSWLVCESAAGAVSRFSAAGQRQHSVELGAWTWRTTEPDLPGVAGIPLTNYAGWFVVGLLISFVLLALPAR
ncbi:MAG TPA: carotenoid biosynthesis protein, partial [Baekduia sp.]|nr:carotenoid biosynthesis protein [Baekduia sp.]